jgi:two-component sensor histidine kinase
MTGRPPIGSSGWWMWVRVGWRSAKSWSGAFEKDTQVLEIQHRVKNNLQMITALMRIEARNVRDLTDTAPSPRSRDRNHSVAGHRLRSLR